MYFKHIHSGAVLELKQIGSLVSTFYLIEDGKRKQRKTPPVNKEYDFTVVCRNANIIPEGSEDAPLPFTKENGDC